MLAVSPSTVSRALSNHPDISVELKQKIQDIAKELKFTPNSIAVNLRKQKSQLIGVIIPKFYSSFVPDVIAGISAVVDAENYQMIIIPTHDSIEKEKEAILKCCDYRVDGILISLSNETTDLSHLEITKTLNVPLVIFDKSTETDDFHQLLIDDIEMAKKCADFINEQDFKHVAAFFGHKNLTISKRRLEGFNTTIAEGVETAYFFANDTAEAYEKTLQLLETANIDAIFGMSDELLVGILAAVKSKHALNTISIVGFSDGKIIPYLHHEITYVLHNGRLVGEAAAALLMRLIANDPSVTQKIQKIETALVVGEKSTHHLLPIP